MSNCAIVASIKEAELDSSNIKSSKIRIAVLAGLLISLLYLTGCCDQQKKGQAADGGRKDTKGIVSADKPQDLAAQPAGNNGANTGAEVVNNLGPANPAGAGLTPGDGSNDGNTAQDSDTAQDSENAVETAEGENTPTLQEQASEIDTDDLK